MMLKKGDRVVMHTCVEADKYHDKVWTCVTDEQLLPSGIKVVWLDGFRGAFATEFLVSL